MRRLRALLALVPLAAIASLQPATPTPVSAGPADLPNILVIVTDDQRTDMMNVMDRTRQLFGANGTKFTNGFATTPLCCPSRSSIFTGQYVHNHGVRSNDESATLDQSETVQRHLDDLGYRTGLVGKYLNGWDIEDEPPSFDRHSTFVGGYWRRLFNINGRLRRIQMYSTDFLTRQALRFLRNSEGHKDSTPWLLFLTVSSPHAPWAPEPEYNRAPVPPWSANPAVEEADRTDKPEFIQERSRTPNDARKARRDRLRTLMSVDDLVSDVFQELGALDERTDTLAFFLSDNGFLESEHSAFGKRVPYEQSIAVPFFARWPGRLPPGTNDPRFVANIDIAPTIYDAVGVTPSYVVDGRSILEGEPRDRLLVEYERVPGAGTIPAWAGIRRPSEKYVEYYANDGTLSFQEYYDLDEDPWELTNLLADGDPNNDPSPATIAELRIQLQHDLACAGTSGPTRCP